MSTFVGIDLGTTNSVVAHRNRYGRPEVIANREGQNITPSVVYFGTDPPAVGQEAKEWARLGDSEIASFFKPHMGSPLYQLQFHGKTYSATDLSALVLKRLKDDAELALGQSVDRAVITVPAYFGDAQRKATIEAGNAAGFQVLRIINEPTAATLAYGLNRTGIASETVLIYDLGGGTFDVTVARIAPEDIVVLATAGDHDLGGKNWDDRIATFLAEQFAAETGFDPLDDPVALNEVLVRSEQAKWALSERTSTRITLQLGSRRQSFELSRVGVRGHDVPPHGPHPAPDRGSPGRGAARLARASTACCWSVDRPACPWFARTSQRWPASRHGPASTSTRSSPWARPSRRPSRWASRLATHCPSSRLRPARPGATRPRRPRAASPTSCRTAWGPSPSAPMPPASSTTS